MTLSELRRAGTRLTSPQYQAARLAIKGLSQIMIAVEMQVSRSQVGLLIEEAESVLGVGLPRVIPKSHKRRDILGPAETSERLVRRQAIRAEIPDVQIAPGTVETCEYCGLRWHSENWPDVAPWFGAARCDLKIRRLNDAYIGSALGAAI